MSFFSFLTANSLYVCGAGLLFLVCSSKHLLIYNEELLILASFLVFVGTSAHTMGDTVAATLQARRDAIQHELRAFLVTKETMWQHVKTHTHTQKTLVTCVHALGTLVEKELHACDAQRAQRVQKEMYNDVHTYMHTMMQASHASLAHVHANVLRGFAHAMIHTYKQGKAHTQTHYMAHALRKLHAKRLVIRMRKMRRKHGLPMRPRPMRV